MTGNLVLWFFVMGSWIFVISLCFVTYMCMAYILILKIKKFIFIWNAVYCYDQQLGNTLDYLYTLVYYCILGLIYLEKIQGIFLHYALRKKKVIHCQEWCQISAFSQLLGQLDSTSETCKTIYLAQKSGNCIKHFFYSYWCIRYP